MKRIDMICLIADALEKNFDGDNGSWLHDAEKALEAIEDAGMLPPFVLRYFHQGNLDETREHYRWEPENE